MHHHDGPAAVWVLQTGSQESLTSRYTVTSMLTMSPSSSGRESGMPWHTHSFTEVQTLFGNLPVFQLANNHSNPGGCKSCAEACVAMLLPSTPFTQQKAQVLTAHLRHGLGLTISERRWVSAVVDDHFVHRPVDLICRHPWLQQ